MTFLRDYLLAIQCFTRVPMAGAFGQPEVCSADSLRASAGHFPGVGWLAGMLACAVFALLGLVLPASPFTPFVAALGCTIATALLTGGAHETGLAHTADALTRHASDADARTTEEHPPLRAAGTLVLLLALLAKIGLLAVLAARSPIAVLAALLAGHVLSRWWALWLPGGLQYPGDADAGISAPPAQPIGRHELAIAGAWSAVAMLVAGVAQGPAFAVASLVTSGVAVLWMRRTLARQLRGLTRDSLGATQNVCEIAFYLGAAVGTGIA